MMRSRSRRVLRRHCCWIEGLFRRLWSHKRTILGRRIRRWGIHRLKPHLFAMAESDSKRQHQGKQCATSSLNVQAGKLTARYPAGNRNLPVSNRTAANKKASTRHDLCETQIPPRQGTLVPCIDLNLSRHLCLLETARIAWTRHLRRASTSCHTSNCIHERH